MINGGAGNDVILGGSGNDTLIGGDGNDWLGGNKGNDQLRGGNGADILVGGEGLDWINTSNGTSATDDAGDDLIVSGRTIYDATRVPSMPSSKHGLRALHSPRGLITFLLSCGGSGWTLQTQSYQSVTDTSTDVLFGGAGNDWFFAQVTSTQAGFENPDESATELPLLVDI